MRVLNLLSLTLRKFKDLSFRYKSSVYSIAVPLLPSTEDFIRTIVCIVVIGENNVAIREKVKILGERLVPIEVQGCVGVMPDVQWQVTSGTEF